MYLNAFTKFLPKLIISVLIFIIAEAPNALGTSTIKSRFLTAYPSAVGSRLDTLPSASNHCGACHYTFGSGSTLNPYGAAIQSNGFGSAAAIAAIGSLDSDGDGFTNDEEIEGVGFTNIPTFPGLNPSNVSNVSGVTASELTGFLVPVVAGPSGSLQVTLGPAGAVTAGAQWNVDGGAWQNSAAIVTGLSVGSHTVNYKAVTGWTAPESESVSITDGVTTAISRTYTLFTLREVILVYKTTLKINPSAFRDPGDPNVGWKTGSSTATAWMIIDVNLADPNVDNIQAALIPFGKGIDPNDGIVKKVYVNDSVLDITAFSILSGLEVPPAKAKPDIFLVDFTADNIAADRTGVGIVDARMQGTVKMTKTKTSPAESGEVAGLLKGTVKCDSLYDDTLAGSGTVSAKLDSTWTKRANDSNGFDGVFADVVAGIKATLLSTGYIEVTQTP